MRSDTRPGLAAPIGAVPSRTVLVLDAIKHAILTGALQPGESLVETDLAGRLGVSKTPVREALKTLAGAGLVTMSPYKGATVRSVDEDLVRSVYDLRLLLEPEALRRAVHRAGSGGRWAEARSALDRSGRSADRATRSLANRDFHRALYGGCGNALLIGVLDGLRDQTALVSAAAWQRTPTWQGTPSWQAEAAEHDAILAAAVTGDAGTAAQRLTDHIQAFLTRNFPTLGSTDGT